MGFNHINSYSVCLYNLNMLHQPNITYNILEDN